MTAKAEVLPRYIFRRGGMLYLKLQPPGGKLVEKSLGTSDVHDALERAREPIKAHERFMYQRRQQRVARIVHGPWAPIYPPGRFTMPDGRTGVATTDDLTFDDGITPRQPNGGPVIYLQDPQLLSAKRQFEALDDATEGKIGAGPVNVARPSIAVKDYDDDLLDVYIRHAGLNAARAKEARELLHLFKKTTGKTLAKATRDDGRALVAAMGDVKSATAKRKLVPLRAAVNLAIGEGKHVGVNPFANIIGKVTDPAKRSIKRKSFDDKDMKSVRANLGKLSVQDQLLVRLLACTGMRLAEAFSFDHEQTKNGVRYVEVAEEGSGTQKTAQSHRRVPLPKILLPHLRGPIKGKLFTGLPNSASTRLGEWLRYECKITDPAKVMYSLRHRAKDQLREDWPRVGRCPRDVAEEIFGREKMTTGDHYGDGSPITVLKKWIDYVGGL